MNSLISNKSNKIHFILLGILHGGANLGGAVLNKYAIWKIKKIEQRIPTIALVYVFLMVTQVLALWTMNRWTFKLELNSFILPIISLIIFMFLSKSSHAINQRFAHSNKFFELYSAIIGLMLIIRYIINL